MVDESVDDKYEGCSDKMKNILDQNFAKERKFVGWKTNNMCAEEAFKIRGPEDVALTKDHLQAICTYTGYINYDLINQDIREQKNTYGTSFKFHTLHFFLTTAIQILNPHGQCYTTYRRTKDTYEGQVGQTVRFGCFASSSIESDLTQFGKNTCFKITTCLGADLKQYSKQGKAESEILIPPYETFTIKNKLPKGLTDCEMVYVLENKGHHSNLNCKLVQTVSGPSQSHR